MKPSTLRAIINAFHTASDDLARPHLNSVGIRQISVNEYLIFACNGCYLSELIVKDDSLESLGTFDGNLFFLREQLPALKLALKEFKHGIPCISDNGLLVINLPNIKVSSCRLEQYPNLSLVKPNNLEAYTASISFNAEYLLKLVKSLSEEVKETMSVKIEFNPNDKHSPIIIKRSNELASGLLMPVRM